MMRNPTTFLLLLVIRFVVYRRCKRLTEAPGYDAEATLSRDGEWIVFTSARDGDLEIYKMRTDGTELTRLTDELGYDGGPFFFQDGSRIVWRRFSEDGLMADVWTMNTDGSDQRPITDFGSLSWAPYLHPSGEYIFLKFLDWNVCSRKSCLLSGP